MEHHAPLAERMRPKEINDIIGQEHLTGPNGPIRLAVEAGKLASMILWGPPGTGKTSIANAIANTVRSPFFQLSAINSGVKEVREVIVKAQEITGAVLFIDEIHRFNKGQQDALLGAVEKGVITLIGATTENPSFEVNGALLSWAQVFVLRPLGRKELRTLAETALATDELFRGRNIRIAEDEALVRLSGGDGRKLLNLLELTLLPMLAKDAAPQLTDDAVMAASHQRSALYDKKGEQHYDIISAFIKSMRGSDPNGAVYWLARMIEGGEEATFIARRMLIFSSEDVGNANPNALLLANATFEAVAKIGFPESRIILSQCAVYLATSPKSNASYEAIGKAQSLVAKTGDLPVPLHIRNAPTGLMKDLGYGKDYLYSHLGKGNFLEQEYLPQGLQGTKMFDPGENPREAEARKFLKDRWKSKYGY